MGFAGHVDSAESIDSLIPVYVREERVPLRAAWILSLLFATILAFCHGLAMIFDDSPARILVSPTGTPVPQCRGAPEPRFRGSTGPWCRGTSGPRNRAAR